MREPTDKNPRRQMSFRAALHTLPKKTQAPK